MRINIEDIVMVAVPENTKKYREYGIKLPAGQKDDFQLPRGQVWEFGILNPASNHFKTVREIEEDAYYVVGAGCVKQLNFSIEAKDENFEKGIELKTLHRKNKALIKAQLDAVLKAKILENQKRQRAKKLKEELLKDRQEYLKF